MDEIKEKDEIIQVVNNIVITVDKHDWEGTVKCFTEEVLEDYSSMFEGALNRTKARDLVEKWKFLLGFKATHHSITNHKVAIKGNEAECFSYVDAWHYLPGDRGEEIWIVRGHYNHHLVKTDKGWKVDTMKLTATIVTGNNKLLKKINPAVYDGLLDKWKKND